MKKQPSNRNEVKHQYKSVKNSPASAKKTLPIKSPDYKVILILLGITVITLVVYSQVSKSNFLNWDDNLYVTENPDIQNTNTKNIELWFTKNYVSNYLPLTILSYAIDYKINGLNPRVFTITNLIIHILNTLFVFWFVLLLARAIQSKGTDYNANSKSPYMMGIITSVLFAIHPINVESVAWISERKNLLFTFFFMLSLISYARYLVKNKSIFYILSILLFVCSLLSKGVAVSLSFCVLAIDYLFQRRLLSTKVIVEKIPFFTLSLVFGIITIVAQKNENTLVGAIDFPFFEQISFASYGFVNYLYKLIIPVNLSAYYSYPEGASVIHYFCLIITLLIIVLLVIFRKRMSQLIIFSVLFYLANIVFLIQLIPVGNAIMADRYLYVSSIGFFLIIAVMTISVARRFSVMYIFLAIFILLYGFASYNRLKVWNNSLSFWDDVIAKDKHIPRAWNNRGVVKNEKGDFSGALLDFNSAIGLMPEYQEAFNNRGIVYYNLKMNNEAISDFTKAIQFDSSYTDAYYNRGTVKNSINDFQGALEDLNQALLLNPNKLDAYLNRANVKIKLNDNDGAIKDCEEVLKHNTNISNAYGTLASAYYNTGRLAESIMNYSTAIKLEPNNINYYHNRGAACFFSGNYGQAIDDMNIVLQDNPMGISYYIRGMARIKSGNTMDGCNDLHLAINAGLVAAENEINTFCGF